MNRIKCYFLDWVDRENSNLMRHKETGEVKENKDWGPGAMFWAPWLDDIYSPQLEHVLVVRTPGGDWTVDSEANNCTRPNPKFEKDGHTYHNLPFQADHHCWVIHGTPPGITVNKNGVTCGAGAGSILQGGTYHGFLRNGHLEEC